MSFIWLSILVMYCSCYSSVPTIPANPLATLQVTRCGRSPQPTFHLIPAALYSNGIHHFIRPLSVTQQQPHQVDVKRPTRQQQSAVVQQVTINQNTAFSGGLPSFGFGGFKHPFSSPHHHHSHHGFGGPQSFGGFRGRSFGESSDEQTPAPKCPLNYIFSCQPTVTEAPCDPDKSCY
ncbi:hypothetical protein FF38_02633 [Lucilia cuprina]|uniref:VM domain-containing protein n=1 Tax=Lucilia cuprina TaxID=7375 RepID=A0A0L0CHW6_LUCCU|nr:hypothetical protein FF38_02633 [Lucilia cuprina]